MAQKLSRGDMGAIAFFLKLSRLKKRDQANEEELAQQAFERRTQEERGARDEGRVELERRRVEELERAGKARRNRERAKTGAGIAGTLTRGLTESFFPGLTTPGSVPGGEPPTQAEIKQFTEETDTVPVPGKPGQFRAKKKEPTLKSPGNLQPSSATLTFLQNLETLPAGTEGSINKLVRGDADEQDVKLAMQVLFEELKRLEAEAPDPGTLGAIGAQVGIGGFGANEERMEQLRQAMKDLIRLLPSEEPTGAQEGVTGGVTEPLQINSVRQVR